MNFLKTLFTIIGIILGVIIIIIGLFLIIKPYGIDLMKVIPVVLEKEKQSSYDHPYLNVEQEAILESAGINLEEIPTEITLEQKECAISILGEKRIEEIANGSTPTIMEILKIKECL
ncbi:MAG: hypothetical protein PHF88_02705 [Candidatus Pacebacteria bacterium]|nr:hypothetical protein [Candidatus Paceibacterota bacterium]